MRVLARVLLVAAVALGHGAASASHVVEAPEAPASADRIADTVADIEALPEAELKQFYLRCSRAAVRGRLSSGEVAVCSVGYERLLQRSFGGDFTALLEWRRNPNRDREYAGPSPF